MGTSYFGDAGVFLIDTLVGFYLLIVILRFLLQSFRADFYNPISQFVAVLTDPPLRVLRRFIPRPRGVDLACVVLALAVSLLKLYLIAAIGGVPLNPVSGVIIAIAEILQTTVYVFIVVTIGRAILSWFQHGGYNPLVNLLHSLSEPLLSPLRRMVPTLGGLDFSPFVLIILLTLALKLIVKPIADSGYMMLL